jgi:hypothetical protein
VADVCSFITEITEAETRRVVINRRITVECHRPEGTIHESFGYAAAFHEIDKREIDKICHTTDFPLFSGLQSASM